MSIQTDSARLGPPRRFWGKRLTIRQSEEIMAYLLISPWIIGFLAFILGPMLASFALSFFETNMFSWKFVGLSNYTTMVSFDTTRSLFWKSLYNTAYYVAFSIPLTIGAGFMIALLLNQDIRGRSAYRIIYYLPSIIPGIAASMVWLYLFQPEFGVINWLLSLVGIEGVRWLFDTRTAKLVFVIMSVWGAGGNMLIFLAGLQGIPTELYEAARLDGAVAWRLMRHITLPMMSPTIFFVVITNIIGSFQIFTNAYVMTGGAGGPANSTMMYVLHLYLVAFRQYRLGYASALAWVLFLILLVLTLLIFKSSSLWVYYETEVGGERA
ncbi:MAG: sugar ABC transporter permease [Caldilineaceae bacterium]|nr:sugar ABC transporter permease [Caldilineaceae bacterium]